MTSVNAPAPAGVFVLAGQIILDVDLRRLPPTRDPGACRVLLRVVPQMTLLAPEPQIVVGMVDQVVVEVRHGARDLDYAEPDRFAIAAPPFLAGLWPDKA